MAHLEVKPKSRSRWWLWLLIALVVIVIALFFLKRYYGQNESVTTTDSSKTVIDSTAGKLGKQN
jgi:DMSO reductase anchor subunit